MTKKLIGILGTVASVGAAVYHVINPAALGAAGTAIYTICGTLLALLGTHPLDKTSK